MAIDDDDERQLELLRELGLEHLAGKPAELQKELAKRIAARDKLVEEYERSKGGGAKGPPPPSKTPRPAAPPVKFARPSSAPTRPRLKSSTLLFVTKAGGPCRACRHANQGTVDFREGRVRCWKDDQPKTADQRCDVSVKAPRHLRDDPPSGWATYFLFEPFDGKNGTWGVGEDYRVVSEDADHEVQISVQSHLKVIPGKDL
jgi:hypothetical protein